VTNRVIEAILRITGKADTNAMARQVGRDLDSINKRAAAFNRQNSMIAQGSRAAFAAVARYAAPGAMAYAAKAALVDFAAVERQMERIGITADASAEQTKAAFTSLQQVTKQFAMPLDDGIRALDTLVSSGLSLQDAMAFLPSVLATAQASGSVTEDIANTAIKASSALKIQAGEMQRAFDIMVAGGKAGQFELKDMAAYIPELANSFSSLGYTGQDGLKQLIALLQTLREDTGTAEAAATQAQNIFGKMYSSDTAKKFSDFGIDLRKEMDAAKKSGEDAVSAFVRLSKEAVKGDLSKLPLLFTDQEFRLGMQSLMTSADSYKKFIDAVNSSKVDGTVLRDVNRVLADTQSKIDKMASSWDKLKLSAGETIAPAASTVMDSVSRGLDFNNAKDEGAKKRGYSWLQRNLGFVSDDEADDLAYEGGYRDEEWLKAYRQNRYLEGKVRSSTGRQGMPVITPEFPGSRGGGVPVPMERPVPEKPRVPNAAKIYGAYAESRQEGERMAHDRAVAAGMPSPLASIPAGVKDFFRIPSKEEFKDALKIDATGLKQSGDEAGQSVASGGREAGDSIKQSASSLVEAGERMSASIVSAAKEMASAASAFNRGLSGQPPRPVVNADTGRSMAPAGPGAPNGGGGGGGF